MNREPSSSHVPPETFELRREERIDAALEVEFESGVRGLTRNVSGAGFYVETDARLPLGGPVAFTVEFDERPGGALRLSGDAKILRVDDRGGRWGCAAAIQWRAPQAAERPGG